MGNLVTQHTYILPRFISFLLYKSLVQICRSLPWYFYINKLNILYCLNKTFSSYSLSTEVTLPRLQSEIKVALFLFASHSFLANNLRFMVKLTDKTIGNIYQNKMKRFYSKMIYWTIAYLSITVCFNFDFPGLEHIRPWVIYW
jgi:flagellar biosynthesis protein FlhB